MWKYIWLLWSLGAKMPSWTPCIVNKNMTCSKKLQDHMKSTGEWCQFFPGSFAPSPYDESWWSFHFPWRSMNSERHDTSPFETSESPQANYVDAALLSSTAESPEEITQKTYWDSRTASFSDLASWYSLLWVLEFRCLIGIIWGVFQENFRWMPYDGLFCERLTVLTMWAKIETFGRVGLWWSYTSESEYIKMVW